MKKYLVKSDTSTEQYSMCETLFAICDSKEEAIKWIRENQKVKIPWNYGKGKTFDFKKNTYGGEGWESDERIAELFVEEFNGEPLLLASYIE